MPLDRKIEQHSTNITNKLIGVEPRNLPLSIGIATDAVTVFDFEKGDSGELAITSLVEVFACPAMNRTTVEKYRNKKFVGQKFHQVFFFYILRNTF